MINETILTIGKQIGAKELNFAKFTLLSDNEKNQVTVKKGKKFLRITYNNGSDLYDIQKGKIRGYDIYEDPEEKGYYNDQLRGIIETYFKFEYVMDGIRISGL